ncbi:hypothetical protein F5884DRAFT_807927 [Xylogone sp. PMI_703]|nr:hypothetical protein F5884DRAFT_807927 [Xylogone sp. PMI_703]
MSKKTLLSVTEVTSVGQGYNTFLATAMPSLVDTNTSSSASIFTPSVSICTSSHDVYNSLSIDASIAMNTLWGSFEDKMKYIKSLRITSTSVVILVTATVENQYSIQGPPVFREQYTDAKTVYYQGGDSFVSGITQGAQFIASFVFHATTEESYQNVINTAEATFNGFSTSIDASLTTDIKNISASTQVNVQFNSTAIGLGTTPYPNVPDGVVDFALKLNTLPLTSPQVLDFSTTPYSAVAGCPDFTQIVLYAVKYQDPTDSGLGISDLELMAKLCHDATTLAGITYDYYNLRGVDPSIDKNLQGLENIIQAISDWRMKVYIDPTVPNIADPTADKTLFKEAVANYQLKSGSLYGGLGGGPFVDIQPDWIPWGVKLTGSQLWAGGAIQRIQNTYSTQLDGTSISVPYHGYDTDDTTQYSFQFGPNDTITAAGCTFENRFGDTLVENISIAVDNQDALVLPPVIFTGIQNWVFPSNSRFVGWAGRSDRYLNALQAQFVIFSPANWKMPEMVQVRNNPFRSRPSPFKNLTS